MAPTTQHYNWHVRALTVPGPDTDLSLFVSFDNVRYLFGCGEGTQRAFVQKRFSTRGLAGVFLPDGGSKGRAGLPGMIMTVCDAGIRKLDVIGPPDTTQNLATLRASVYRNVMQVDSHAHPHASTSNDINDIYAGSNLSVQSIALRPSQPEPSEGHSEAPPSPRFSNLSRKHLESMFSGGGSGPPLRPDLFGFQPAPSPVDTATQMVYICRAPDVPGKFDNNKAIELKVPNGPIRGKLVRGETIEFDDPDQPGQKKIVTPENVIGGGHEGAIMITVNCTQETLPALLSSTAFGRYQTGSNVEGGEKREVGLMIHRVPTAVWQDAEFRKWIKSFGPTTQHLVASTDGYRNDVVFNTSAWNLLHLSLIDSDIFPLVMSATLSTPDSSSLPPNTSLLVPNHYLKMQPRGQLEIFPSPEKDVAYPTDLDTAHAARREMLVKEPEFAVECAKARHAVRADPRWGQPHTEPGDDITVTTLGTGSAIPSKHRNVSATHLDIPGVGGILLDCGEGTLGQLRRRYGTQGLKKVYEDLKMIFVSHMHADHHLGLQAIMEDRLANGITGKLYLVSPIHIAISLSESGPWSSKASAEALSNLVWIDNAALQYSPLPDIETSPSDREMEEEQVARGAGDVPVSSAFRDGKRRWPERDIINKQYKRKHSQDALASLMRDLGLSGLRVPRVAHRGFAWGLVMHHTSGWKIVYSGDTTPCNSLVQAGTGATLLIHEATLEDDKPDVARDKGHSTFSQAIEVGQKMGAKKILLNHFSQRYPKIPKSRQKDVAEADGSVISISYDLMGVQIGQMWRMAYYLDAAELLFKCEEDEEAEGDMTKALEEDVNPTMDTGANGEGRKGKGKQGKVPKAPKAPKAGKVKKDSQDQASTGKAAEEDTQIEGESKVNGKRAVSPSRVESEPKKSRSEEESTSEA